MWGLPMIADFRPWPGPEAPELRIAAALPHNRDLVILAGANGPRGRYGLAGLPVDTRSLSPHRHTIRDAIDERPADAFRVVALGYELGAPEVRIDGRPAPRGQPAGLALDLRAVLVSDHQTRRYALVGSDLAAAERLRAALHAPSCARQAPASILLEPTVTDAEHSRRIRIAKDYIAAGNVYQVNVTRRLRVTGELHAPSTLAALTADNPVAHGAYVRTGGIELLSNSMETLLTLDPVTRIARSYPIKGTKARGDTPSADSSAARALRQDPKERAEHVMIVDLVRNDLGKVATPGSVRAHGLMHLEAFRGVWHGVTCVEARLAAERSAGELVAALFPGGSITGAPKRRAMQIIDELEGEARGFYTGSLGLVTPDGRVSLSIMIRTLVRDADGWSVSVGGGIVADSTAEREIEETREKVEVFRRVLGRRAASAA
ncbi:MAG: anthranilate synthase component I family protein [Myxococcota bacterium]